MSVAELTLLEIDAAIERADRNETLVDEAERLGASLREFVPAAWTIVWPNERYVHGWHIDAICEHLEAVTSGEIRRLQVWVPPGSSKSTVVSIMWPAWEWTRAAWLRYITASYDGRLSAKFAQQSRELVRSSWYAARWPHVQLKRDMDLKTEYANTAGGERIATSVGGQGTGRHAHRIVIDDPLNAKEIASEVQLAAVAEWHDGTLSTRFADPRTSAEVLIQQRLDERDLAGHVLRQNPDAWTVLCLPEVYEPAHPYAWNGDPRATEGDLLWPERIGPAEHEERARTLNAHRAAGQLQQRPAAREGAILQRRYWRFYRPQARDETDEAFVSRLPRFESIWQSWDTSLKDTSQSDRVAGTVWGKRGADLWLLPESRHTRLNLSATKAAIRQVTAWVETFGSSGGGNGPWAGLPHRVLVEKASNGPEVIAELRHEIRGLLPTTPSVGADKPAVKKTIRAEAASPALEGGNIYLPGLAAPERPEGYDPSMTPEITQQLIEQSAAFPNAEHDDLVDSFTQVVNWTRARAKPTSARLTRPTGQLPRPGSLAGV